MQRKGIESAPAFSRADIALILVAMVWGSSYPAVKSVLDHTSILAFVFIRFLLTGALMLPILLRGIRGRFKRTALLGLLQGILLFLIFFCETAGIQKTSAANAAFFISTCVLMTPLLEFVIYRTPLTRMLIYACILSCIGAGMIGMNSDFRLILNKGDFIILIAAFLRSAGVIATKYWGGDNDLDSGALTAAQMITVAFIAGVGLALDPNPNSEPMFPHDLTFWLTTLYLVIFCTLIAFYVQTHMVRKTSPSRVILVMGTEPVFGAIFATLLLGESLSGLQYAGGLLIVLATYVGIAGKQKPHQPQKAIAPYPNHSE